MSTLTESVIAALRKNPNTTSLKEFLEELDSDELKDCKEEILSKTFAELLGISNIKTENDVIALLKQHKQLIVQKPISEICNILGCGRELVFKTLSYLKEDVREPIKIVQIGNKRAAKYTVIDR